MFLLLFKAADVSTNLTKPVVEGGALYSPSLLPDYRGPYFKHINSKLVQLDVRDQNNELIAPWDMYDKVNVGAIVLAICSLHVYIMPGSVSASGYKYKDCKVSHLFCVAELFNILITDISIKH